MANITHGADTARLDQLATDLEGAAKNVNTLVGQLTGEVKGLAWVGDDSNKFKSSSHQQLTDVSNKLEATLRAAARKLQANAKDQRRATAAGGGSGSGTTGTGGTPAPEDTAPAGGGDTAPDPVDTVTDPGLGVDDSVDLAGDPEEGDV